jgi:UDP-glucose 4-epimerase
VSSGCERRPDHALGELRPRRREEGGLRPRAHLDPVEEEPPHLFTERRTTRLARGDDLVSFGAQRVRQKLGLRGLAGAVQALEGDEHSGRTIRRVRAVVTGGAGFIGSHVVEALLARGDEVHVLDDLSSGRREHVTGRAEFHRGDIRFDTDRVFTNARPDVCFHLAAQADVRVSVERPDHDAEVNVIGTIRVLDAARRHGTKIVFSSTGGAIYGECDGPADEYAPRRPLAPYGTAKLSAEEYIATYNRLYGSEHVVLRYANVYGPRQEANLEGGVVSVFMRRLAGGETAKIFGDGHQTRDFVYVGDVADATLRAVDSRAGVYNVGTGIETSVLELYATIERITGIKREAQLAPARPGEILRSVLDRTRIKEELGWEPQHSLEQGLSETWAHVRSS